MYMIIKKHILNMSKYVGKIFLGPWIFAFQYAVQTVLNSFVKWIQGIWISLIHSTSDTTQYITHFYSSFFLTRALTLSNGSNKNFFIPIFCHESEVSNFNSFFFWAMKNRNIRRQASATCWIPTAAEYFLCLLFDFFPRAIRVSRDTFLLHSSVYLGKYLLCI